MNEFTEKELELAFNNNGKIQSFDEFLKLVLDIRNKKSLKQNMLSKLRINSEEFKKKQISNDDDLVKKQIAFEYIIKRCLSWYRDVNGDKENDLCTLKLFKLLFFISAVRSNTENKNNLIDSVFNNFYAMPYGHIEYDIYNLCKKLKGELKYFTLSDNKLVEKENFYKLDSEIDSDIRKEIDLSISELRIKNSDIINYKPFELINLSHCWYSWKKSYYNARGNNIFSKKIPIDDMKIECKIFKNVVF